MDRKEQIILTACFLVLWIAKHGLALNPSGKNVCSTTQQYVAYEAQRHTQTITDSYRTCCKRRWGVCYNRCTRYRTRQHVYYTTISHIRSRPIYFCCDGWRQAGAECTIPVCLTPCKHGDCVWPNTCRCHSGFEGPYCRNDINECKRMGLPDGFVPTPTHTTTAAKPTTAAPSVPSSSTMSPFPISSLTKVAVSSSSVNKGQETSSITQASPSMSPLQPSSSANESISSTSQMISASSETKATPSTSHASPSSKLKSFTLLPQPSPSSTITSLQTSRIGTTESTSVTKATESPRQPSLSTMTASESTSFVSQASSSLFSSRQALSTESFVAATTSHYYTAKASQALSSVTTSSLLMSPSDFLTSLTTRDHSSSETTMPKASSIAPTSSLALVSSSIGSGLGSGSGSGEESGSGLIVPDEVVGEDYLPAPRERQRRDNNNQVTVSKISEGDLLAHDPSPISYPYRCTHTCSNTYGSFTCGCYTGYYLHSDKKTCYDIDECAKENGGCSHRCVNTVGSYRCECPHPSLYLWKDRHTCKAHGMSIICTKDYMQVNFEKQLLRGLDVEHLRLTDSTCKGWDNRTHLILRTELDKCGTVYEEKGDIEIYKNAVVNRDITIGNIITRIRGIRVPFQCSYQRVAHVSGVGIRPDRHRLTFTEDGFGQFTFTLAMFHGPQYRKAYSHHQFPIQVKLRDRIYFEVKVVSEDANLIIFAEKCVATPYIQRGKGPEYVFLENGCVKDPTLSYSVYSPYSYQRFSLEAFRFLDDVPDVYFHCDVIACHKSNRNSRCYQGCQAKGKRQTRDVGGKKETGMYSIAEGPLSLRSIRSFDEESKKSASNSFGLPQYSLFVAGIACTALLVGTLQVVKHYRSRDRKGYQKLAVHECQD